MIRTTNGIATSACAIGTSTGDVRRSSGGSSSAMRKPKPSVTAETPSGTLSSPSRRRRRDRAAANDGETADRHRDRRRGQRVDAASCGSRRSGRRTARCPRARCRARGSSRSRARRRCRTSGRRARRSGYPSSTAITARFPTTTARSRHGRGRRAVSAEARSDSAVARLPLGPPGQAEERDDRDELHDRQRGRERQVQGLRRLAVDLGLERGAGRAAEDQDHAERREGEQERDRGGREDAPAAAPGSVTVAERAPPRRAQHARCLFLVWVEVGPETADDAHHDRVVEEHVREEDRAERRLHAQREECGRDDHGRQHEGNDRRRPARTACRGSRSVRARTRRAVRRAA